MAQSVYPPAGLIAGAAARVSKTTESISDLLSEFEAGEQAVSAFYDGQADAGLKLAVAVERGDDERAATLIAGGADVNVVSGGRLPLIHLAIGLGHARIMEALLASGHCDLTARDAEGRLASDVAALVARDVDLAERLADEQARQFQKKGIDPRRPGNPDYGNWR
jgi:hypothetical protein